MRRRPFAALLAAVALCAGCGSSSSSHSGTTAASTVVGSRSVEGHAVLVDDSGHTLYTFARGVHCSGKCATAWPPLLAHGGVTVKDGSGVDESLLGTVQRPDGTMQVTYDHHPLYLFARDDPGQSLGAGAHAFGGAWDVVRASGKNPFEREKTKGPSCAPNCGY